MMVMNISLAKKYRSLLQRKEWLSVHSSLQLAALASLFLSTPSAIAATDKGSSAPTCWLQDSSFASSEEAKSTSSSVQLFLANSSQEEARAGQWVTITALLTNEAESGADLALSLRLPRGWSLLSGFDERLHLAAGQTELQLAVVRVASQAPMGSYQIGLEASDLTTGSSIATGQLRIQVKGERAVDFSLEEMPSIVAAGSSFHYRLLAHNKGNMPVSLLLEPSCSQDYPTSYEVEPHLLAPGETLCEEICFQTADGNGRDTQGHLFIRGIDGETGEELFSSGAPFEVVQRGARRCADPWVYVPGTLRTYVMGEEGKTLGGVELAGSGYIDPARSRKLEYLFRVPTDSHSNLYNEYQRLFLGIVDPHWKLALGDTSYSLSPLTEQWHYARGASFDQSIGKIGYGLFYLQNRLNHRCQLREWAGYLGYDFGCVANGSINWLRKQQQGRPDSKLVTLQMEYDPSDNLHGSAEYGYDTTHDRCHKRGDRNAYRFELRGKLPNDSWFYGEKYYAGRSFYGYYNDADLYSAGLDTKIWSSSLRLNLSTNFYRSNLGCRLSKRLEQLEPASNLLEGGEECGSSISEHQESCTDQRSCAPRRRQYNGRLSYHFGAGGSLQLTGLFLHNEDHVQRHLTNFRQGWGGCNLSYNWYKWNLYLAGNWGQQTNYALGGDKKNLQSYYGQLYWNPTIAQRWGLHYEAGQNNFYDAQQWRYSVGASWNYRYGRGSWFELYGRGIQNRFYSQKPQVRGRYLHLLARWLHTFNNGYQLAARLENFHRRPKHENRDYRKDKRNEYKFLVSYTIPFNTPSCRRGDLANLTGRVYDEQTGEAVRDAVISLAGDKVMTDDQGCFLYEGIPSAPCELRTELLPKGMMASTGERRSIALPGGTVSHCDLALSPAGVICGTVLVYDLDERLEDFETLFAGGGESIPHVQKGGLANVRITIDRDCGEEIYTTATDALGRFRFDRLRPGRWRVILHDGLPPNHQVANHNFDVFVSAEQASELTIKVVPKQRTLRTIGSDS